MTTFVYRCYATDGRLLYIGMSGNVDQRMSSHRGIPGGWARECTRVTRTGYATRELAVVAEADAICAEAPEFNRHNPGHSDGCQGVGCVTAHEYIAGYKAAARERVLRSYDAKRALLLVTGTPPAE